VASDFGCPACLPLSKYQFGTPQPRTYDFEQDGIANYGLLPDFIQAASQLRCSCQPCSIQCPSLPNPTPPIAALFNSAEDTIEMWEKVQTAAKGVPTPEPVLCSVFDDGYTNQAGPSDAVYIKIKSKNDFGLPACVPSNDSPIGVCRKWFGKCFTAQTKVPVFFHVFDDGGQNDAGMSDAIFVLQPRTACVPANNGTCRKWFGEGITQDGRKVTCSLFDDGYTNLAGPTDAIYSLGILNQQNLDACLPDGTTTGLCRKWFGRCQAFVGR
jgi:hypothetical protein